MKPKTTIVLIVLLAVGAGYLLVRHAGWFNAPPKTEEEKLVLRPALGQIESVRVVAASGEQLALSCAKGQWRLDKPLAAKADAAAAQGLIDTMSSLQYLRKIAAGEKDADASLTGLDKPLWTVTLTDAQGVAKTIAVGKPAPLSRNETYVRVGDSGPVYVVGVDLAAALGRAAGEYRDRDVFDLAGARVERLAVESAQRAFELSRTGGQWDLARPVAAKAQQDAVEKLVSTVRSLRVKQFVADQPQRLSDYGLDKPVLLVRLWTSKPTPQVVSLTTKPATAPAEELVQHTLAFGRTAKDEVYAKLLGQPAVFKFDASILKDLQPELIDLRERNVLAISEDLVVGLDVQAPGGKASLKKDGQWRLTLPYPGLASAEQVSTLLQGLASLQAQAFEDGATDVDLPRFGLDHPRGRVDIHQAGKDRPLTLLIGRASPSGEMTFVKAADSHTVAVVRSDAVEPLLADPAAYWSTTILELPAGYTPIGLAVVGAETVKLEHPAAGWRMVEPVKAEVDMEHLNKVLDHLEKMTVSKIESIGPQVPDKYRKVEDLISVNLTVQLPPPPAPASKPATQTAASSPASAPAAKVAKAPPAASQPAPPPAGQKAVYILRIGKIAGQVYVWIENQPIIAVGLASSQLFDDFSAELRQRTVLRIDPQTIQKLSIVAGKDSVALQHDSAKDEWTSPADPYVRIDADKVRSYLEGIRQIQAVRFLSYTSADVKRFELAQPWMQVELAPAVGEPARLLVSSAGKDGGRYAVLSSAPGVFLLSAEDLAKLTRKLQDFQKRQEAPGGNPPSGPMAPPGFDQ